ncbi:MAG: helix-turn-helix domain-containing protein [Promicromonosporaceae bacterium]|nr:helix-turn-helix domain-containing protein [Promicromonosporaceae bacterium]
MTTDVYQVLGRRLRAERLRQDRSQRALAQAAGVSEPTVGRIESGTPIAAHTLAQIAEALGLRLTLVDAEVDEPLCSVRP